MNTIKEGNFKITIGENSVELNKMILSYGNKGIILRHSFVKNSNGVSTSTAALMCLKNKDIFNITGLTLNKEDTIKVESNNLEISIKISKGSFKSIKIKEIKAIE